MTRIDFTDFAADAKKLAALRIAIAAMMKQSLVATPEPASILLMATSLIALGLGKPRG